METMQGWEAICRASTGSSNTWIEEDGRECFYEPSQVEHDDGSITGSVFVSVGAGFCKRLGSFKISGSGDVVRGPGFLKGDAKRCEACGLSVPLCICESVEDEQG